MYSFTIYKYKSSRVEIFFNLKKILLALSNDKVLGLFFVIRK